jgi:hypothetical protein
MLVTHFDSMSGSSFVYVDDAITEPALVVVSKSSDWSACTNLSTIQDSRPRLGIAQTYITALLGLGR